MRQTKNVASRPQPATADSTLLRRPAVEAMTGLKRAAVYERIRDGLLPRPVRVGVRASGWPLREISAVCEALIAGLPPDQIQELVRGLEHQRAAGAGAGQ